MPKKSVLVIINPKAGVKSKATLPELVEKHLASAFEVEIKFTERAKHATELAIEATNNNKDIVVAIGGDGTINEVAQGVKGSNSVLAIVPMGSGNGLGRHLNISLDPEEAIKQIASGIECKIDVCEVNGIPFLCTAGIGFDAHISHVFDQSPTRGFLSYFKLTLKSFFNYLPEKYRLISKEVTVNEELMLITVANANQWGNNVYISPNSSLSDGVFEVCRLRPFPKYKAVVLARKLFNKRLLEFEEYEQFSSTKLTIERNNESEVHIDGEPYKLSGDLHFLIHEAALNVIVPKGRLV